MKKKTNKSKKSVRVKPAAMEASYDGKNWKATPISNDRLEQLLKGIEDERKILSGPVLLPLEDLHREEVKIVVAVAENPNWLEPSALTTFDSNCITSVRKSKKLECGRAAAQAAHAVSKLKLSYALQLAKADPNASLTLIIGKIMMTPITTIVVKARDTDELLHIAALVNEKNLHSVDFQDENREFYKSSIQPMTALAIGPYLNHKYVPSNFYGITDYLPLWKCACDPVS